MQQSHHVIQFQNHSCFDVNYSVEDSPMLRYENASDFMLCKVKTDEYLRLAPFRQQQDKVFEEWEMWQMVEQGSATRLSIAKIEFSFSLFSYDTMVPPFYEVAKQEQEMRFEKEPDMTAITVQFAFLSSKRYQQYYGQDLFSMVGIIGGLGLLLKIVHDVLLFLFRHAFDLDRYDNEQMKLLEEEDDDEFDPRIETRDPRFSSVLRRNVNNESNQERAQEVELRAGVENTIITNGNITSAMRRGGYGALL